MFGPNGAHSTGQTHEDQEFLKALKARHRDNQLVRRKGRVYLINKTARATRRRGRGLIGGWRQRRVHTKNSI